MIKQQDFKISDHKVLRLCFDTENLNLSMFQLFTDKAIPDNLHEFSSSASSVNFGMTTIEIDHLMTFLIMMFLKRETEETLEDLETE
jgi:hypothetical protein